MEAIIKNIFSITKGRKALLSNDVTDLRYIQIDDLRNNNLIKYCLKDKGNITCTKEDILIAWDGANAGTIGYGIEGAIGSTIARLRTQRKDIYIPYVGEYLKSKSEILRDKATGATIPHISRSVLENIIIPLPILETQKKIAAILDKADELRQNDRKILEKYDQLALSVFVGMFGDPVQNEKEWKSMQLFEVCKNKNDIKCGPFGTQLQKEEYKNEGVPLWGITQINSNFKIHTKEFLNPKKANDLQEYNIEPLDIVMSRKGNVGKCAIYPRNFAPGIMHSDVLRVRCNRELINPIFLSYQFKWSRLLKTQINNVSSGAIMAGINVTKLKNITIQVPPATIQNKFVDIIENLDYQKHCTHQSLQKSEELFQSLLQRAFRGELV